MRKLNMGFAAGLAKMGAGAGAAYLYDELMADAVVRAAAADGNVSLFDVALMMTVGWAPFLVAGHYQGDFWASFAGATAFNRVDNFAVMLFGARAASPFGPIARGETLDEAAKRMNLTPMLQPSGTITV